MRIAFEDIRDAFRAKLRPEIPPPAMPMDILDYKNISLGSQRGSICARQWDKCWRKRIFWPVLVYGSLFSGNYQEYCNRKPALAYFVIAKNNCINNRIKRWCLITLPTPGWSYLDWSLRDATIHWSGPPLHRVTRHSLMWTWISWSRKAVSLLNKRFETSSASYKDFNCISSKSKYSITPGH